MRTRGRYSSPYRPAFLDRPIQLPIPWQTWITDVPGGNDRDVGGGGDGGDNADDANDAMEESMDLSSTVVLKHQSRTGGREDNHNTADRSPQSNALTFCLAQKGVMLPVRSTLHT